jgi:hypothetical protein
VGSGKGGVGDMVERYWALGIEYMYYYKPNCMCEKETAPEEESWGLDWIPGIYRGKATYRSPTTGKS